MADNAADLLRRASQDHPDDIAVIADTAAVTWRQLDNAGNVGAVAFAQAGLQPGDRLVLRLPTSIEFVIALVAAWRADLVVVPVDPARGTLPWIASRVSARGAVVAEDSDEDASLIVVRQATIASWLQKPSVPDTAPTRGAEDLALLAGAARPGRIVMLSHRAVLSALSAVDRMATPVLRPRDRVLQVLPLYHLAGLISVFLSAASAGAAVVLTDAPPAERRVPPGAWNAFSRAVLSSVHRHRVSVLPGTPALYRLLLRAPDLERSISSVRLFLSSASPLGGADAAALRSRTGSLIWESYGISESASLVTTSLLTSSPRPGSVGLPLPGVEVRIEPAADLEDLAVQDTQASIDPDSDPGRIAIRGPQLFSGYWPDGSGGPDADGWFTSSDIGYFDERNELHLLDPVPETVVIAGFPVYPREVEAALLTHSYVRDAAVVGIPGRAGVELVASVVAARGTQPTEDDLVDHLAQTLPLFKRPTRYRLVPILPRTEVGNLDRAAVRTDWAVYLGVDMTEEIPAKLSVVPGSAQPDDPAADPAEVIEVSQLDSLGSRLPGIGRRGRRSAQDTDRDLFGDEFDTQAAPEPGPSDAPRTPSQP
jgi:long-chain acyl-CoA synthetase